MNYKNYKNTFDVQKSRCSKFLAILFLGFLFVVQSFGQVANYSFSQLNGTYNPLSASRSIVFTATAAATSDPGLGDDLNFTLPSGTIPFSFTYNGLAYTGININTNGFVTFGATLPTSTDRSGLSNSTAYSGAIVARGSDLSANTNASNLGEISYEVLGSGTNRTFAIQYSKWRRFSSSSSFTENFNFQIRLNEANGVAAMQSIDIVYGACISTSSSSTCQVGLRGPDNVFASGNINNRQNPSTAWNASIPGTTNSSAMRHTTTVNPASGLTFTFTPPNLCTGTPAPGNTIASSNPVCIAQAFTLSLQNSTPGTGVSYQWQKSTDGITYTNSGLNAPSIVDSQFVPTYYQAVVTCTASGLSSTSTPVYVTMITPTFPEPFSSTIFPPCQWTINNAGIFRSTASANGVGVGSAEFNFYNVSSGTDLDLVTFTFSPTSGSEALVYDYAYAAYTGGEVDELEILTSDDGGAVFKHLVTYTGGASGPLNNTGLATSSSFVPTSGQWANNSILLPANTNKIMFRGHSDFGNNLYIDNVNLALPPACNAPSGVAATNVRGTSADISWACTGCSGSFNLEYGPTGFTPGTGTMIIGASNPYGISGLNPNTSYDVYLQQICGGSDVSTVTGPYTFTTTVCGSDVPVLCSTLTTGNINPGNGLWSFSGSVPNNSCGFSTPGHELLYTFTPTVSGLHQIDQDASGYYIDYLFKPVSDGCSNTGWTCIQDLNGNSTSTTNTFNLIAGVQYYILLDQENTNGGQVQFQIVCAGTPPLCVTNGTPNGTTSCESSPVTLSWSAAASATGYDVYFNAGAFATNLVSPNQPGTSYNVGNLSAGSYAWKVIAKNAFGDATGCTDFTFTVSSTPSPGDSLEDPIVVPSLPASINGNNLPCYQNNYYGANNQSSADVFYKITTGLCTGSLQIGTCSSSFDTYIHLLDASGVQVADDDDACTSPNSSGSLINFAVSPGTVYYVVVEGYSSNTGAYTLDITPTDVTTDDGNVCTTDACDPSSGNISHTAVNSDDNNVCTIDGCDPSSGVYHNAISSDDGNVCTTDGCDPSTGVYHNAISTDDNNVCTIDGCDPSSGPYHNSISSDDGNACTTDACDPSMGVYHTPVNVDDNNACTTDGCDPSSGVYHNAINADDNNVCTIDGCDPSTGVYHNAISTDDNNVCTIDGCDPSSGPYHNSISSDDGDACTTDGCDPSMGVYHTPVNVDDNNGCTTDGCDPSSGVYHNAINADDNNVCTIDGCDPSTGAAYHNTISSDDGDACTTDGCDPSTGVYHNVIVSDDGNACTADGCDPSTGVYHNLINTDDNNVCTTDGCDSLTGVYHTPVNTDDGNACTIDGCDTSGVYHYPVNTDDHNPCTTDACDPSTGNVTHTPVNVDDNNACTNDGCNPSTGIIVHTPVNVDDNNECTTDVCNPVGGPIHILVNTNDNNACTTDACNPSTGAITHTTVNTNDNNACTTDACDPATGAITHTAVNANDNNPCTIDGCDPSTGVYHIPVNTNDNNPCTTDACDSTGAITHTDATPVVTATGGTIACYNGTTCVTVTASGGQTPYTGTGSFCGYGMGTWTFTVTDSKGCSADGSVTLTQPTKVNVTTTTTPTGCSGNTGTATASATGGTPGYTYVWKNSSNTTVGTAATATALAAGTYTVTVTDSHGCTGTATAVVGSGGGGLPSTPGNIQGANSACRGTCGITYSIAPVSGATNYVWILPNGASGNSSGTSITVCFNTSFNGGYICVKSHNACGYSQTSCLNISRTQNAPNPPVAILPASNVLCPNSNATYSVANVTGATSYLWSVSQNLSIVSGQGTNTVVVHSNSQFTSGSVSVKSVNCKGTSSARIKNLSGKPGAPVWRPDGTDNKTMGVCGNSDQEYDIYQVTGATSYTWTGPAGVVFSDGYGHSGNPLTFAGMNSGHEWEVYTHFPSGFVSGTISVYATNSCGNGPTTSLYVQAKPNTPGAISSSYSSVCKSNTKPYSISSVSGATSYTWAVTGGATIYSGQGTTSVQVKFTTASSTTAVLTVKVNNACGSSATSSKTITVNLHCKVAADGTPENDEPTIAGSLTAYPNPTTGKATVTFNSDRNAKYTLKVVDMIGNILISENITAVEGINMKEINLEGVAQGLYMISVQTEGSKAETMKLIIE